MAGSFSFRCLVREQRKEWMGKRYKETSGSIGLKVPATLTLNLSLQLREQLCGQSTAEPYRPWWVRIVAGVAPSLLSGLIILSFLKRMLGQVAHLQYNLCRLPFIKYRFLSLAFQGHLCNLT